MTHEPKVGELPALWTLIHPDFTWKNRRSWSDNEMSAIQNFARSYALAALAAEREARKDEARWISVDERLPRTGESVLAYDGRLIAKATHYGDGWGSATLQKTPTHWMPLPAPPAALQAEQPRGVMTFPATVMVHTLSGHEPCCEKHAKHLANVMAFMGSPTGSTPITETGVECRNCINEAKKVSP